MDFYATAYRAFLAMEKDRVRLARETQTRRELCLSYLAPSLSVHLSEGPPSHSSCLNFLFHNLSSPYSYLPPISPISTLNSSLNPAGSKASACSPKLKTHREISCESLSPNRDDSSGTAGYSER